MVSQAGPDCSGGDGGAGLRLLCDEMLRKIGRWLRAAGYDTAIAAPSTPDELLLAQARSEGRLVLTCDRRLAPRVGSSPRVVVLESESADSAAARLREKLGIDWLHAPFTRCLVDNDLLRPARADELAKLPESSRRCTGPIMTCPVCRRVYWPGSHVRRMQATLERWAGRPPVVRHQPRSRSPE